MDLEEYDQIASVINAKFAERGARADLFSGTFLRHTKDTTDQFIPVYTDNPTVSVSVSDVGIGIEHITIHVFYNYKLLLRYSVYEEHSIIFEEDVMKAFVRHCRMEQKTNKHKGLRSI